MKIILNFFQNTKNILLIKILLIFSQNRPLIIMKEGTNITFSWGSAFFKVNINYNDKDFQDPYCTSSYYMNVIEHLN
jgi:hypothetical protein